MIKWPADLAVKKKGQGEKESEISNGNRAEWSPIRSVIKRVVNKIGRPANTICLITSMITDQIRAVDSQSDLTILL